MEMTGTCPYCGQTRLVEANTQQEANRLAAAGCHCDNNEKKAAQLMDLINQICGEEAKTYGMEIVTEQVIEAMKEIGYLCTFGHLEQASIRLPESTVVIKRTKDGVAVSRKKLTSVKLES